MRAAFLCALLAAANAATTRISPGTDTLHSAADVASSGDVIELLDGAYQRSPPPPNTANPVLMFPNPGSQMCGGQNPCGNAASPKELTVRAVNSGKAILDAQSIAKSLKVDGNGAYFQNANDPLPKLTLIGLDIMNGIAQYEDGGCIYVREAILVLQDCKISGCSAPPSGNGNGFWRGGGLFVINGDVTMSGCEMSGNDSPQGAAMYFMNTDAGWSTATIHTTLFASNTATTFVISKSIAGQILQDDQSAGGAIFAEGTDTKLNLSHNTFRDNYASANGACDIDTVRFRTTAGVTAISPYRAIPFVASDSELYNNTHVANTARCISGIMLLTKAPITQRCTSLGEWTSPAPLMVPPASFTGCRFQCDPGYYGATDTLKDSKCTAPCTVGSYCPLGSAAPTPCPLHTYMPTTGATVCTSCPAFSTTSATGATSVAACRCVLGRFMDSDANGNPFCRQCSQVIAATTTLALGATASTSCVCVPGYYEETNATTGVRSCIQCDPDRINCSIPGLTLANLPVKRGGWRLGSASEKVIVCFNPLACVGADGVLNATLTSSQAPPTSRRRLATATANGNITAGDALCAPGHGGVLCGACTDGWYGYKESGLCAECTGSMALAFVPLVLLGLAALAALLIFLRGGPLGLGDLSDLGDVDAIKDHVRQKTRKAVPGKLQKGNGLKAKAIGATFALVAKLEKCAAKVKILISLWQILMGIGPVFAIPFPPFYEVAVSSVGSLLQIELPSLMPLDCMIRTSFYSKLVFKTVWPLCAYAALFGLASLLYRVGGAKRTAQADSLINFAFLLIFILYPSISTSLFSMFYCFPLEEDGTSWLRVDLTLECSTATHGAMLTFTFVMLGLHTIGTPLTYAYLFFWKHHSALEALKEQELDDAHVAGIEAEKVYVPQKAVAVAGGGSDAAGDEAEEEPPRRRLEPADLLPGYMLKLCGGYEHRSYWFELFETIRKVLLVGVPSTFPERGGTLQLYWGLMVCFMTFGAYMKFAPFVKDSDDQLSQLAQLQIFLTLLSSLALRASPPSKIVGELVTVVLVLVPLIGVALETPLLDELGAAYAMLSGAIVRLLPGCAPPALKWAARPKAAVGIRGGGRGECSSPLKEARLSRFIVGVNGEEPAASPVTAVSEASEAIVVETQVKATLPIVSLLRKPTKDSDLNA